jgi:predicted ferric reductase
MDIEYVIFLCVVIPLAVIFSAGALFVKSMSWLGFVAALFWFLNGFFPISYEELFPFHRMLGIVFIVIGIAFIFLPIYNSRKNKTIVDTASDNEIDSYKKEIDDFSNETKRLRSIGRRKRIY